MVVAAYHVQLDTKVALKFLLPQALENPAAVARFVREARTAVKLTSEHVARVSDVGELPNGAPYMVMEYLDGGDLAAWLEQRGALPVEQAVEFVVQACVGVAEAHALGVVHRDLKPANLFCVRRSDGQLSIKVLDFGISKLTDGATTGPSGGMTKTSAVMGTPLYMSPEQMKSAKRVDTRTDIWALGVILFELIAGRGPFVADTMMELAVNITNEPPPALRSFRPDAPPELEAVILRCLEKDPHRRFRNVGELALALLPFAPKRAKASVERISGIIQAAGLSVSALDVPPSPQAGGTQVSSGALPATGRTTAGGSTGKSAAIGLTLLGVLVLGGGGTYALLSRRAAVHHEEPPPGASQPPTVDMPTGRPETSASTSVTPVETAPAAASVATAPAPTAPVPQSPSSVKTAALATTATARRATTATAGAGLPPAPAASKTKANCSPNFTYDSDGNKIFKPECFGH